MKDKYVSPSFLQTSAVVVILFLTIGVIAYAVLGIFFDSRADEWLENKYPDQSIVTCVGEKCESFFLTDYGIDTIHFFFEDLWKAPISKGIHGYEKVCECVEEETVCDYGDVVGEIICDQRAIGLYIGCSDCEWNTPLKELLDKQLCVPSNRSDFVGECATSCKPGKNRCELVMWE